MDDPFLLGFRSGSNTTVIQSAFGLPQKVLSLQSIRQEALQEGMVQVKIKARPINPSDLLSIEGVGQYSYYKALPRTPGFEGIGYVIKSKAWGLSYGDRVLIMHPGTWQQTLNVPGSSLFKIPHTISDDTYAAQLHINPFTAWVLITEVVNISSDIVVLVNAANSAIANVILQISKIIGFKVIALVRHVENKTFLFSSGAKYVLDDQLILQHGGLKQTFLDLTIPFPDVVLDSIGGMQAESLAQIINVCGRYISYGSLSGQIYRKPFFQTIQSKKIKFSFFFLAGWERRLSSLQYKHAKWLQMVSFFIKHDIDLPVAGLFSLENYQAAIEASIIPKNGKIILL